MKGINLNRGRGCKSANNEEPSASSLPQQSPDESPQEEDPVARVCVTLAFDTFEVNENIKFDKIFKCKKSCGSTRNE